MADDEKPPEGEDELVLTTDDQAPADDPPADPPPQPTVEELAQKMGWQPKEAYRGDPEKWRPADEFIVAGHEIQRNLSQDLRKLRTTVDTIQQTSSEVFRQRLEDEKRELAARYEQAFEAGDMNATFRIGRQITEVDQKIAQPVTQPTVAPEVEQFTTENASWFNKDPLATERAVRITNELAAQGYSTAYQLAAAKRAVVTEFPHLFQSTTTATKAPSTHSAGRTTATVSGKKGFAQLPIEAQKVAQKMFDDHGVDKELYAKQFFITQERSQQRG